MKSLPEAVALFQHEITAALAVPGAGWVAERVTLSLEVELDADGKTLGVRSNEPDATRRGHTVTLEFRLETGVVPGGPAVPARLAAPPAVASKEDGASQKEQALTELTALFGPPGFNSSARAAVFCEAMHALDPAQAAAVGAALARPAREISDEAVRRARHLIVGMVQSGPLKSTERAAGLLVRLFERWTAPALVQLIEEGWKTQDHWMK